MIYGSIKDYKFQKPKTAKLIIEIAISSLAYDRNKALDYALANVEEYWIVDVENECIEVFTVPTKTGYNSKKIYSKLESINIFESKINLKDIFA